MSPVLDNSRTVYRCYGDDGRLLYVGVTCNLTARLGNHRRSWWGHQIAEVKTTDYASWDEARAVEREAIVSEAPRFNRQGRWADRSSWSAEHYRDYYDATRFAPFSSHLARRLQKTRDECLHRYGIDVTEPTKETA